MNKILKLMVLLTFLVCAYLYFIYVDAYHATSFLLVMIALASMIFIFMQDVEQISNRFFF